MRRFRRKPRVLWLPVHGRDFATEAEENHSGNGFGGLLNVGNEGELTHEVAECTFDYSDSASGEEGTDFRSLQDLASGNNYRLRRIVGKFFAGCESNTAGGATLVPQVDVAAGFIVNRTDDSGNILIPNFLVDPGGLSRGPLHQDTAEDPWIWRRRWILSGVASNWAESRSNIQTATGGRAVFPQTTAHYGSVQDGGHIDQKTARVIGRQERLFFWIQARCCNPDPTTDAAVINWAVDLRLLASLRPAGVGNRRNASR